MGNKITSYVSDAANAVTDVAKRITCTVAVVATAAVAVSAAVSAIPGAIAAITSAASNIYSLVQAAYIKLSVTSTIGAVACGIAISIFAGFVTVNHFKDKKTKETLLEKGWKKIDYLEETKTAARIVGGILSLGLTELFGTHYRVYKTEICDAAGNFLGSTVLQAVETTRTQGERYFAQGDYYRAKECFLAADNNCPSEFKDKKRAIQESIKSTDAEIYYKNGLDFFEAGSFTEAINSFQTAIDLCSEHGRKHVFLKSYNNAKAEHSYQAGQQILLDSNIPDETKYSRANDLFNQAIQICSYDYAGRGRFEQSRNSATANIERLRNVERAAHLFVESQTLWEKACNFEKLKCTERATITFIEADRKLAEVLQIANNHGLYKKWAVICKNKIEGNKLYNEMENALRKGNDCFKQLQYHNALIEYRNALELCKKAQQRFNQIDIALENTTSAEWLRRIEAVEKKIGSVIGTVSLHVPSEILRETHNCSTTMQSSNFPIFTLRS